MLGGPFRVLAFGDSLTQGYYDDGLGTHPYSNRLQELVDHHFPNTFEIIPLGIPGEVRIKRSVLSLTASSAD